MRRAASGSRSAHGEGLTIRSSTRRCLVLGLGLGLLLRAPLVVAQPLLERQTLTGDWNGVRPALSARGFELYTNYLGTLWGNANGGRDTGARWNGYLDFGLEADLSKLGLWDGFGFHADFHWWQGDRPTTDLIGGMRAQALSAWEAAATLRVYNLYLRQALADDRVVLKLGQIAADTDFMVSRYGGVFLNAGFGDLPAQNLNLDAPVYPLAAPGVSARVRPRPWLEARFGAYTADAGPDVAGNHGFGWTIGPEAGGVFFSEIAFQRDGPLPFEYGIGGIYGTEGSAPAGTMVVPGSRYEIYATAQQALIASDRGDPLLAAFLRLGGSPQGDRNVASLCGDAGLVLFGPIPSRPRDALGLAVSFFRFTQAFQRRSRSTFGGGQTLLELTYQLAITPWLVVQPDAQFFFDAAFSGRDAQALGVEMALIF